MYPKPLQKLIEQLKNLPTVGDKTAQRYAMRILDMQPEQVAQLVESIISAKQTIKPCEKCGNWSEHQHCDICLDGTRDHQTICVVTHPVDVMAMEKTGQFKGVYHVLNGLISPMNQVLPNDLNIQSLTQRVNEGVTELILALSATIEGETTALYLAKLYSDKTKITHLAQGLPMGSQLEYMDELTLVRSLNNRKQYDI